MSKRGGVTIVLLVVSMLLGIALGEGGFRLYQVTMPPAAISAFNLGNAHLWYIVAGVGAGLVLFVWSLIAALLGRVGFTASKVAPPATPAAPASTTPRTP